MSDQIMQIKDKQMKMEVIEHVDVSGDAICFERYESALPLVNFDYNAKYKFECKGCPTYGKNLSCPPYSPTLPQYLGVVNSAKVICLRLPLDYFNHLTTEERYRSGFRKARSLLVNELLKYREKGYAVAGSGACLTCEQCAAETSDEHCRDPAKQIYSLESLGVNVVALVKRCFDINLEWTDAEHTADHVCAVGAVFFEDENLIAEE
jgi:predicted metal-binding protein